MSPAVDASASNAAITQCLTEINNLKLEISTHAHETAPHDQRTFNEVRLLVSLPLDHESC